MVSWLVDIGVSSFLWNKVPITLNKLKLMTKKLWKIGDQICVFRKNEYCSFIKKIILGEENKLQLQSAKYIVASWIEWLKCDMFK